VTGPVKVGAGSVQGRRGLAFSGATHTWPTSGALACGATCGLAKEAARISGTIRARTLAFNCSLLPDC
jgi:hypothetical protein